MSARGWLGWCALCVCLAAAAWAASRERAPRADVERLVPRESLEGRLVAALTIDDRARGASWFYAQSKDVWRSREAFGAPADRDRVQALIASLVDGAGRVVRVAPDRAGAYGFGDGELRVRLHGRKALSAPDGDVLFDFAIGSSIEGRAYARERTMLERAEGAVLELAADPRALCAPRGEMPPLLDTRLLAGTIGPAFRGFRRVFVDVTGGDGFELVAEPGETEGSEATWYLVSGEERVPAIVWRVGGYTSFLIREEWRGLASARQAAGLGLEPPRAKVTLAPSSGEVLELWVSAPDAAKRIYVWNKLTNVVLVLDAELADYLVPKRSWFLDTTIANPWERWIGK